MNKELILSIAMACHAANKSWCEANGDFSQFNWDDAEEWQRESAIKGVEFRLNNPNAGHDAQHNSWMDEKIADGWVYGEKKDPEAKTHPCIVPFEELPEFQQKKDALFCAVVDSLKDKELAQGPYGLLHIGKGSFGDAIKALKNGKRVCRSGWNGKGLFVFMQVPADINSYEVVPKMQSLPQSVKDELSRRANPGAGLDPLTDHTTIRYRNQLAIVKPDNEINGWTPSGSDSLAEDWCILD